jgi:hypothetical protein
LAVACDTVQRIIASNPAPAAAVSAAIDRATHALTRAAAAPPAPTPGAAPLIDVSLLAAALARSAAADPAITPALCALANHASQLLRDHIAAAAARRRASNADRSRTAAAAAAARTIPAAAQSALLTVAARLMLLPPSSMHDSARHSGARLLGGLAYLATPDAGVEGNGGADSNHNSSAVASGWLAGRTADELVSLAAALRSALTVDGPPESPDSHPSMSHALAEGLQDAMQARQGQVNAPAPAGASVALELRKGLFRCVTSVALEARRRVEAEERDYLERAIAASPADGPLCGEGGSQALRDRDGLKRLSFRFDAGAISGLQLADDSSAGPVNSDGACDSGSELPALTFLALAGASSVNGTLAASRLSIRNSKPFGLSTHRSSSSADPEGFTDFMSMLDVSSPGDASNGAPPENSSSSGSILEPNAVVDPFLASLVETRVFSTLSLPYQEQLRASDAQWLLSRHGVFAEQGAGSLPDRLSIFAPDEATLWGLLPSYVLSAEFRLWHPQHITAIATAFAPFATSLTGHLTASETSPTSIANLLFSVGNLAISYALSGASDTVSELALLTAFARHGISHRGMFTAIARRIAAKGAARPLSEAPAELLRQATTALSFGWCFDRDAFVILLREMMDREQDLRTKASPGYASKALGGTTNGQATTASSMPSPASPNDNSIRGTTFLSKMGSAVGNLFDPPQMRFAVLPDTEFSRELTLMPVFDESQVQSVSSVSALVMPWIGDHDVAFRNTVKHVSPFPRLGSELPSMMASECKVAGNDICRSFTDAVKVDASLSALFHPFVISSLAPGFIADGSIGRRFYPDVAVAHIASALLASTFVTVRSTSDSIGKSGSMASHHSSSVVADIIANTSASVLAGAAEFLDPFPAFRARTDACLLSQAHEENHLSLWHSVLPGLVIPVALPHHRLAIELQMPGTDCPLPSAVQYTLQMHSAAGGQGLQTEIEYLRMSSPLSSGKSAMLPSLASMWRAAMLQSLGWSTVRLPATALPQNLNLKALAKRLSEYLPQLANRRSL